MQTQTPEEFAADFLATVQTEGEPHKRYVDYLAALKVKADKADRLRGLLAELIDQRDEPCRYDHNGFCQSHYFNSPCVVERARAALKETP